MNPMPPTEPTVPPNPGADAHAGQSNTIRQAAAPHTDPARWDPMIVDRLSAWAALSLVQDRNARLLDGGGLVDQRVDLADLFIPLTTKVKTGKNTWESRDLGATLLDPARLPRVADTGAPVGFGEASVDGPDPDPEAPSGEAGPFPAEHPTATSPHFGPVTTRSPSLVAEDQSAYRTDERPILVVEGPAGCGKTTTSIFVAQALRLGWLQHHRPDRLLREPQRTIADGLGTRLSSLGWPQQGTPFPIRLDLARYRGGPTGLWSWLHDALQEHGPAPTAPELVTFFQSGFPTTWFLDGLEETPLGETRATLLRGLLDTLTALPYATVIIGTRPEPLDPKVVAHYPIIHLPIEPLSRETALAYAREVIRRTSPHPDQIEAATARITTTGASATLDDLLRTPLHTTLLSFLALREPELPNNRAALLGQVFEVVLQREKLKPVLLQLNKKEQQTLRWLHERAALYLYFDPDRPTLRFAELRTLLHLRLREQTRDFPNPNTSLRRILQVSNQRLGLLLESSPDRWTFGIRSFTEYFAACALLDAPEPVLLHRLQSLAWTGTHNTLLYLACERLLQTATTDTAQSAATNLLLRLCDEYPADPPELHDLLQTLDLGAALALRLLEELGPDAPGELREGLWERALRLCHGGPDWVPRPLDRPPKPNEVRQANGPVRLATLAAQRRGTGDESWDKQLEAIILDSFGKGTPEVVQSGWRVLLALISAGNEQAERVGGQRLSQYIQTPPWWTFGSPDEHPLWVPFAALWETRGKATGWLATWASRIGPPFTPMELPFLLKEFADSICPDPVILTPLIADRPIPIRQLHWLAPDWQQFRMWLDQQSQSIQMAWMPFRWIEDYTQNPTAETLAALLDLVANAPQTLTFIREHAWLGGWPLKAVTEWCTDVADLTGVAAWLRAGLGGDVVGWAEAEDRFNWRTGDKSAMAQWLQHSKPWNTHNLLTGVAFAWSAGRGKMGASAEPISPAKATDFSALRQAAWEAVLEYPEQAGRLLGILGLENASGLLLNRSTLSVERILALPPSRHRPYFLAEICHWAKLLPPHCGFDTIRAELNAWGLRHGFRPFSNRSGAKDLVKTVLERVIEAPNEVGLLSAVGALTYRTQVLLPSQTYQVQVQEGELPQHLRITAAALRMAGGATTIPKDVDSFELAWLSMGFMARMAQLPQDHARTINLLHSNLPPSFRYFKGLLRSDGSALVGELGRAQAPWTQYALPSPTPTELTMHLRGPVLNAIPCLSGIRIFDQTPDGLDHFDIGNGEEGQWVVLIGENGTGKTTLLRAIALALMEPERATKLLDNRTAMTGATGEGQITVKVSGHDWTVKVQEIGGGDEVVRAEKEGHLPGAERPWIVGYGARRGNALGDPRHEPNGTMMGNLGSLFENPGVMVNGYAWLLEQQGWAVRERETSNGAMGPQQTLWNVVKGAMEQLLQVEIIEPFTKSREGILVRHPEFGQVPLRGLSEGYLGFAGWVLDMVYRWVRYLEDRGETPTSDLLAEMRGIVLVDEIDLHLHPRWQVEIIPDLRRLFPRLSFVVTTHNPLTLYGARPGEVRVLQRDPEARGGIRVEPKTVQPGEDMDHLLLELFGVSYPYDPQLRADLASYHTLLREGKTKDDPQRIALSRRLDERLRMGGIGTPGVATVQQRGPTPEELALLDDVMSGKGRR